MSLLQLIRFSGVSLGEACTIVIRGATQQILDESERSLHDALCVLQQTVKETRVVYGGGEGGGRNNLLQRQKLSPTFLAGSSEMLMAAAVQELANKTPGKESMAVEAFARALRQLPTIIADNAGYDSSELVSKLRALHSEGNATMGLGQLLLEKSPYGPDQKF